MNNEAILNYLKHFNIDDLVIDNNILTNEKRIIKVDITSFDLKLVFMNNVGLSEGLANQTVTSFEILKLVNAVKVAMDSYNKLAFKVFSSHNKSLELISENEIFELVNGHFLIAQAIDIVPGTIKATYNAINAYIINPQNENDINIQQVYYQLLDQKEAEARSNSSNKSNSYSLTDGHSMLNDDNNYGYVKLSAIILVIVNIGIMLATWIISH